MSQTLSNAHQLILLVYIASLPSTIPFNRIWVGIASVSLIVIADFGAIFTKPILMSTQQPFLLLRLLNSKLSSLLPVPLSDVLGSIV